VIGALAFGTSAHAYLSTLSINKCLSGKVKTEGKAAAAYTGCYSKNAAKPDAGALATCNGKASTKLTSAFVKLDLKGPCLTAADGAPRDADTATFALNTDGQVGNVGKCDSAKQKLVGKYVAAITGCYSKAAGKTGVVDNVTGGCTDKAAVKFQNGVNKTELKGPCTTSGLPALAALQAAANAYIQAQTCALDPGNPGCAVPTPTPTSTPVIPTCGNGANDPGEACDASASPAGWAQCGSTFTCTACNCACPSTVTFAGDATDAATVLDTGWTGISHRAPAITNSEVTVALSCAPSSRPCGVCTVTGPIANPNAGAGQIDNRRCTNDTSIRCTADAPCLGGGGTCQYFFGSALPLAAGGVTTCVVNQFNGLVTGTANVETGDAANSANLTSRVYNGIAIDNPCARCVGDATINDGLQGGTCDSGTRSGLACDANGTVPGRPDFGSTSLDCPLASGALIATLPIDLTNATSAVTKTLTAFSPGCSGAPGEKCLCGTCNNLNAEPCEANADCPDPAGPTGPICNGNRCLGGTNAGAPCTLDSACPGGGLCNKPGEPTKPSACLDNTLTPGVLDCSDTAPVDGEGECTSGPVTQTCSVASGHGQRGCTTDANCGGDPGSCESDNRRCFLTGGLNLLVGTNTLVAQGVADAPMADVSNPTLGSVFCVGPTGASAVNNVAGLPGPGRVTIKGQAVGLP
jgi:hypothetical protein